jgi:phosphatidylserine decarboxylase
MVWYPIPIGLGVLYIGLSHYFKNREKYQEDSVGIHTRVDGPLHIRLYASLPLRYLSQCWGYLNDLTVPVPMREPLYKFYSWVFGCKLNEMVETDLKNFENLGQFFYRTIKPECRTVASSKEALLVFFVD